MHADFDLITNLLGQPGTLQVTSTGGRMAAARRQGPPWILSSVRAMHQLIADAPALRRARRLARHLPRRRVRMQHEHRVHRPALELTLDVLQRLKQAPQVAGGTPGGHATAKCLKSTGRQTLATAQCPATQTETPPAQQPAAASDPMARDDIGQDGTVLFKVRLRCPDEPCGQTFVVR
jgi:hypothetical protein